MGINYTSIVKLRNPDKGDWDWHYPWYDNSALLDFCLGGLLSGNRMKQGGDIIPGTGLEASIAQGYAEINEELTLLPADTLSLSPPDTGETVRKNWVFATSDGGGYLVSVDPPFLSNYIPLYLIDTDAFGVLRISDLRAWRRDVLFASRDFEHIHCIAGVLIIDHGPTEAYPASITIWDNNKKLVMPSGVEKVNDSRIDIDLSAFGAFEGTWHIEIRG